MKVTVYDNSKYAVDYENGIRKVRRGDFKHDPEVQSWEAAGNTPEKYVESIPPYTELRAAEYPSIAKQMDMLYWDMKKGTAVWQETIASIKEKYPKPEA